MTTCCWEGCGREASVVPEINIPAQGWPIDAHSPMSCILDIKVCEDHYAKIDINELLFKGGPFNEGLAPMFKAGAAGRQPPDFERAWLSKVPIVSEKYKYFCQMRDKHKTARDTAAREIN